MILLDMALGIQAYVVTLLWIKLLASQSSAQYLTDDNRISTIKYSIINLNGEQMTISWNATQNFTDRNMIMFYRFDDEHEWKQCPQYILDQEYNTGCHFKTEGKDLYIFIKDTAGEGQNYTDEQNVKSFFKPNPPENVTYQWANGKVTIQCNPPWRWRPQCFELEFQYKSTLDQEWKSRKAECCKIEDHELDPANCYSFRLRLKSKLCTKMGYFSEWGSETLWKNGSSIDNKQNGMVEKQSILCINSYRDMDSYDTDANSMILLTSIMAMVLVVFVFLMLVCRLQRIRKGIMPDIPDPKHMYLDLFTDHNGNFQDWMTTENVLVEAKIEDEEEACVIEDENTDSKSGSPRESSLKH